MANSRNGEGMSGITMEQTARIAAVSLQTLRSWRHYSPVLGDLGSRESGQLRFDIGEVALFAPTSEMTKTGKTQPEAVAAALVWLPALARLLDGSADGGDHYGAELVAPDGTSVRYLAVGPDDLAAIVKASSGAASVSVVNLS